MGIGLAVIGGVALLGWLAAVVWVLARRPPADLRPELMRALPDIAKALEALSRDEGLDAGLRERARRARRYVAWPIDLLPWIDLDDLVIALDALRRVHEAGGLAPLERAWSGDSLGWNALRAALGLPREWDAA
ncbi:MAG: hypothetical protein KC619_21195 [Myxococcales bacterium]|nr:hypothetical protein [Myxococcales bacterium]